jgi:hypothetical protein
MPGDDDLHVKRQPYGGPKKALFLEQKIVCTTPVSAYFIFLCERNL